MDPSRPAFAPDLAVSHPCAALREQGRLRRRLEPVDHRPNAAPAAGRGRKRSLDGGDKRLCGVLSSASGRSPVRAPGCASHPLSRKTFSTKELVHRGKRNGSKHKGNPEEKLPGRQKIKRREKSCSRGPGHARARSRHGRLSKKGGCQCRWGANAGCRVPKVPMQGLAGRTGSGGATQGPVGRTGGWWRDVGVGASAPGRQRRDVGVVASVSSRVAKRTRKERAWGVGARPAPVGGAASCVARRDEGGGSRASGDARRLGPLGRRGGKEG